MSDNEIWKDIPNKPGYSITKEGKVRRIFKNGRISYPKAKLGKNGYFVIRCKTTGAYIHRLLAITWIPNPDNKPLVDHIDRNKENNHIDNLRWVTCSENTLNADRIDKKKGCVCMTKDTVAGKTYIGWRGHWSDGDKMIKKRF